VKLKPIRTHFFRRAEINFARVKLQPIGTRFFRHAEIILKFQRAVKNIFLLVPAGKKPF
jgi:hypothetical protein